jgi:hypothetical protein
MIKCDTCGERVPMEPNLITSSAEAVFECPWCETRTPVEAVRVGDYERATFSDEPLQVRGGLLMISPA